MRTTTVRPAHAPDGWDLSTDVLVVGGGVAGISAALDAAGLGAETLILERSGAVGGASAMSDGMVYLGGGTSTQRDAGVEDSPEAMEAFLLAACGPGVDAAKVSAYVAGSRAHHDWLLAHGVTFLGAVVPGAVGPSAEPGQGLMFTGGENAAPFVDAIDPAPRAHVTQGRRPGGAHLVAVLHAAALAAGVTVRPDTRVARLVVSDEGHVVGVEARHEGRTMQIEARRGVVLTAGGFVMNDAMLAHHAPDALRCDHRLGTDGDDGQAIRMAQAVGARTKHMDALEWALPFNLIPGHVRGILVDEHGRRFVNEDTYMGRVGQQFRGRDRVLLVLDETTQAGSPLQVTAAGSAAELETELGLSVGSLSATLARWNEHAAHGLDPDHGKSSAWTVPLREPYAVVDVSPGSFPHSVFTLGGLDTNVDGEVLDLDGLPVPGLFAAGRTTSGIAARGYCSGLSLGDGSFFGRISGASAAGRTS